MYKVEYTDVLHSKVADERIRIKDIFDSAQVSYDETMKDSLEREAYSEWEKGLEEL